jgi:hypothetical protein
MRALLKQGAEPRGFRISPGDRNCFAGLPDPIADGAGFALVVEIFAPVAPRRPTRIAQRSRPSSSCVVPGARGLARGGGRSAPGNSNA